MIPYPSMSDICVAMTNPRSCLYDKALASGSVFKDNLGQAKGISGGFAIVFKLRDSAGKDWAVRVFHRDCNGRDSRYAIISRKLKALSGVPYFLPFEYQEKGILVKGKTYPIVKMEWVQGGENLCDFITTHLYDQSALQNLRISLMRLHMDLSRYKVAHGDIQPGNLRVFDKGCTIRLLDYDGFFCQELIGMGASEVGCPNYQHPERAVSNYWKCNVDNFSFIMLDVVLKIVMTCPAMWRFTNSDGGEACIFKSEDYSNPNRSRIFSVVEKLPGCSSFVRAFADICSRHISSVPEPHNYAIKGLLVATTPAKREIPIKKK